MPAVLALRSDFESTILRNLARHTRDASRSRRLLSIAAVYDGMSRSRGCPNRRHGPPGPSPLGVADTQGPGLFPHECPPAASQTGCPGAGHVYKNFRNTLAGHLSAIATTKPIEIWWQDEARVGQKNGLAGLWARKGTRPRQPADQRYKSAYLFGTICPARGTGAAIMMTKANAHALQFHLDTISRAVKTGSHAAVLMNREGWHTTAKLKLPENITIILQLAEVAVPGELWAQMLATIVGLKAGVQSP